MIKTILRTTCLTLMGLVLSWAAFLLLPGISAGASLIDETSFSQAFPLAGPAGGASPHVLPTAFVRLAAGLLQEREDSVRATRLVERHLQVAGPLVVFLLAALAVSFIAGALARERLRMGTAYASPSVSFLSKRLLELSVLVFFVWSLSPLALPYWAFYPVLLGAAIGTLGYVANLPLKL